MFFRVSLSRVSRSSKQAFLGEKSLLTLPTPVVYSSRHISKLVQVLKESLVFKSLEKFLEARKALSASLASTTKSINSNEVGLLIAEMDKNGLSHHDPSSDGYQGILDAVAKLKFHANTARALVSNVQPSNAATLKQLAAAGVVPDSLRQEMKDFKTEEVLTLLEGVNDRNIAGAVTDFITGTSINLIRPRPLRSLTNSSFRFHHWGVVGLDVVRGLHLGWELGSTKRSSFGDHLAGHRVEVSLCKINILIQFLYHRATEGNRLRPLHFYRSRMKEGRDTYLWRQNLVNAMKGPGQDKITVVKPWDVPGVSTAFAVEEYHDNYRSVLSVLDRQVEDTKRLLEKVDDFDSKWQTTDLAGSDHEATLDKLRAFCDALLVEMKKAKSALGMAIAAVGGSSDLRSSLGWLAGMLEFSVGTGIQADTLKRLDALEPAQRSNIGSLLSVIAPLLQQSLFKPLKGFKPRKKTAFVAEILNTEIMEASSKLLARVISPVTDEKNTQLVEGVKLFHDTLTRVSRRTKPDPNGKAGEHKLEFPELYEELEKFDPLIAAANDGFDETFRRLVPNRKVVKGDELGAAALMYLSRTITAGEYKNSDAEEETHGDVASKPRARHSSDEERYRWLLRNAAVANIIAVNSVKDAPLWPLLEIIEQEYSASKGDTGPGGGQLGVLQLLTGNLVGSIQSAIAQSPEIKSWQQTWGTLLAGVRNTVYNEDVKVGLGSSVIDEEQVDNALSGAIGKGGITGASLAELVDSFKPMENQTESETSAALAGERSTQVQGDGMSAFGSRLSEEEDFEGTMSDQVVDGVSRVVRQKVRTWSWWLAWANVLTPATVHYLLPLFDVHWSVNLFRARVSRFKHWSLFFKWSPVQLLWMWWVHGDLFLSFSLDTEIGDNSILSPAWAWAMGVHSWLSHVLPGRHETSALADKLFDLTVFSADKLERVLITTLRGPWRLWKRFRGFFTRG